MRGLRRMVDEDRYCIDVITQISAVRAALKRVEEEVLRDHVAHCVSTPSSRAIATSSAGRSPNSCARWARCDAHGVGDAGGRLDRRVWPKSAPTAAIQRLFGRRAAPTVATRGDGSSTPGERLANRSKIGFDGGRRARRRDERGDDKAPERGNAWRARSRVRRFFWRNSRAMPRRSIRSTRSANGRRRSATRASRFPTWDGAARSISPRPRRPRPIATRSPGIAAEPRPRDHRAVDPSAGPARRGQSGLRRRVRRLRAGGDARPARASGRNGRSSS